MKKIGKKLGNDDGPRGEFDFIFHLVKSQRRYFTHSFRVKYVVCSPTKVVLGLIELFPSTV